MQAVLNLNHYSVQDEDGIVAKAMEILAARLFKTGPVMDSPDTVKKYRMSSGATGGRRLERRVRHAVTTKKGNER